MNIVWTMWRHINKCGQYAPFGRRTRLQRARCRKRYGAAK